MKSEKISADVFALMRLDLVDLDPWRRGWQETDRVFEKWKKAAEAQRVPLAVVMFPDRAQVIDEIHEKAARAAGASQNQYEILLPNKKLAAILERKGIPYLDLTVDFREHPDPASLYIPLDNHFSAVGHELAAERTARWLASSGLAEKSTL